MKSIKLLVGLVALFYGCAYDTNTDRPNKNQNNTVIERDSAYGKNPNSPSENISGQARDTSSSKADTVLR